MASLVSIKKLVKNFDSFQAVKGISLSVNRGDVLGFLGPNGAGKTTTMRMVTGYLRPTSGKVSVCGIDVVQDPVVAQEKIGYLPEGGPLYGDMTPEKYLKFIADIRGLSDFKKNERIEYVVEKLNLADVFYKSIDTLSKGYRRRVALAQAIIHDPQVLILDEPTDGLDPNQKYEVRELIAGMAKDKAIIISTHILEEVDAICSKVAIIADGKIVVSGEPNELAKQAPEHNSVVVKLYKAPADRVLNDILQIKSVDRVNVGQKNTVIAISKGGKPILNEVGKVIRKKKVDVEEVYARTGSLDDAFRAFTKSRKIN